MGSRYFWYSTSVVEPTKKNLNDAVYSFVAEVSAVISVPKQTLNCYCFQIKREA